LAASLCFALLAFLGVSSSTAKVLEWLINILSSAQIINYIIMCVTYLFFFQGTKKQQIDRKSLPYYGYLQPYGTWVALAFYVTVIFVRGYAVFLPGRWDLGDFFTSYSMVGVAPVLFFGWKLLKGTKIVVPASMDLKWEAPLIDAYEESYEETSPGFWAEIMDMFGFRKRTRDAQVDA
jgi:amino acid transporter